MYRAVVTPPDPGYPQATGDVIMSNRTTEQTPERRATPAATRRAAIAGAASALLAALAMAASPGASDARRAAVVAANQPVRPASRKVELAAREGNRVKRERLVRRVVRSRTDPTDRAERVPRSASEKEAPARLTDGTGV